MSMKERTPPKILATALNALPNIPAAPRNPRVFVKCTPSIKRVEMRRKRRYECCKFSKQCRDEEVKNTEERSENKEVNEKNGGDAWYLVPTESGNCGFNC